MVSRSKKNSKGRGAVRRYRARETDEQKRDRLRKAREYKQRRREGAGGTGGPLEPITDAEQSEVLQRLRVSLGAERLDECVCAQFAIAGCCGMQLRY